MKKFLIGLAIVGAAALTVFAAERWANTTHKTLPAQSYYTFAYTNTAASSRTEPRYLSSIERTFMDAHGVTDAVIMINLKRAKDTQTHRVFSNAPAATTSFRYSWTDEERVYIGYNDIITFIFTNTTATNSDFNYTMEY